MTTSRSDLSDPIMGYFSTADLGLVDAPPAAAFESLTKFAQQLTKAPVALISIVEEENDRQFFTSHRGLPTAWAAKRQTPLSHSFCKHVKASNEPLVVENAPEHDLVRNNLAIRDLSVIAYLGVPIHMPSGAPIGALCVIESEPRVWTKDEITTLTNLAACVSDELRLRAALRRNQALQTELNDKLESAKRHTALRESISMAFMVPDLTMEERFRLLLQSGCKALDLDAGRIVKTEGDGLRVDFANHPSDETTNFNQIDFDTLMIGQVLKSAEQICISDFYVSDSQRKMDVLGRKPGSYIAVPLIMDGKTYGVVEFSAARPRPRPWTAEEKSVVGVIAMYICANLGAYGQIQAALDKQDKLISYVLGQPGLSIETEQTLALIAEDGVVP